MAQENNLIGKQLGSYRIVEALNRGSYGGVYKGKHILFEDDPVVAIKVLHAHLGSVQERDEFIQEAQLLKKLKHPYILPIITAGIQDGLPYIVIEYASGGSLRDLLNHQLGQPLPLDKAITILTWIGQALHHAYQQRIVHRDLKPANILFNAQGDALLADFGIATVLAAAETQQVDRVGTPAYMAPEQFEGRVSMKSDQYALGCIAYELVTGYKPFTPRPNMEAMWYQHAKVQPVVPTQFNPSLPKYIEEAILKALAKQRADRHADIPAFIEALQKPSEPQIDDSYKELTTCEEAIRLDPNNATAYFHKGKVLHKLRHYEEALAVYEEALRLDPKLAAAYSHKGYTFYILKRYEEALAAYEQAIHLDPTSAVAYNNKGYVLQLLKRDEEALMALEQSIRLNSGDAMAYNNKGKTLYQLKRYGEALTAYEQALLLDPSLTFAYHGKGNTLHQLKRYGEALTAYEQELRLDPNNLSAHQGKGNTFYTLGLYEEALATYEQTLRLDPNYAVGYLSKGDALYQLKRYEEALATYEQMLRLDPNYTIARIKIRETLACLGRSSEDQQEHDQAQQLGDLSSKEDQSIKFTVGTRKALSFAQEEAQRFQHNYIGTEHLLLGLIREGESVAAKVLSNLGVELNKIRAAVEYTIGCGDSVILGEIGLTPRCKKVIELAVDEAHRLNHHYLGTEHLLLALVREGGGIAAGVLQALNVNKENVRAQTIQLLGQSVTQNVLSSQTPKVVSTTTTDRFSSFTERAKRILTFAQEEAMGYQHHHIGTEHLLLGLLRVEDSTAVKVLIGLRIRPKEIRENVELIIDRGSNPIPGEISLTSASKKAIELAVNEAQRLNHHYLGTEHLLLGLIREREGLAAWVLKSLGVNLEKARSQIIMVLSQSNKP